MANVRPSYYSTVSDNSQINEVIYGVESDGNIDIHHRSADPNKKITINGVIPQAGGGVVDPLVLQNISATVSLQAPNGGLTVGGINNAIESANFNAVNVAAGQGLPGTVNAVNVEASVKVEGPEVETQSLDVNTQNAGAGTITATNSITGGSVVSNGAMSCTGNLTSGPISCSGTSNFTGLITAVNGLSSGGDVTTTRNFEATGNAPYGIIEGRIATATEKVQTGTVLFKSGGTSGPEIQSPPQAGPGINENNLYVVIPVNPPSGNQGEVHFANDAQQDKLVIKPTVTEFINPINLKFLDGVNGYQPDRYTQTATGIDIHPSSFAGNRLFGMPTQWTRMSDNTNVTIPDGLYILDIKQTGGGGAGSVTGLRCTTFYNVDNGSLVGNLTNLIRSYYATKAITKTDPNNPPAQIPYPIGSGTLADGPELLSFGAAGGIDVYLTFPGCTAIPTAAINFTMTLTTVMP